MGFTKDLWMRPARQPDGTVRRVKNDRWGKGKRWLSVWHDEAGEERSRTFAKKDLADKHWQAMETDRERGDYLDPKAGRELLRGAGQRWLASRVTDPATQIRYESWWRLHVEPTFGRRRVKAIRPSEIQAWLAELGQKFGSSTAAGAYLVLQGCLELAVADQLIKANPARSPVVRKPRAGDGGKVQPWTDDQVGAVIDAHPDALRLLPVLMAGCGIRVGEATGVALEDIDFGEKILHVRRQIKRLGTEDVYALPKSDLEREVPLPEWVAAAVQVHVAKYPPKPCTLPWEKITGKPRTHSILFRWGDGGHVRYRTYSEQVWKPAVAQAGIIAEPGTDKRGRKRYVTTRKEGPHQLRHFFASVMLADGVSVKELAEYLGHHDAAFTLRVYTHLLPSSHDRARQVIDARMFRPRAVSDGTGTE
jgi:integrase